MKWFEWGKQFSSLQDVEATTKMGKKANIFDSFSHSAIQQFKEAFGIMDTDKDGLLSSSDLVAAFTAHGKNIGGGEAQVNNLYPLFVNFVKASILLVKVIC